MVVIVKFFQRQNITYKGRYVGEKLEPNRISSTGIITGCTSDTVRNFVTQQWQYFGNAPFLVSPARHDEAQDMSGT